MTLAYPAPKHRCTDPRRAAILRMFRIGQGMSAARQRHAWTTYADTQQPKSGTARRWTQTETRVAAAIGRLSAARIPLNQAATIARTATPGDTLDSYDGLTITITPDLWRLDGEPTTTMHPGTPDTVRELTA